MTRPTVFDGKSEKILSLENHQGLATFTLDLRLVSANLQPTSVPFTETTPEMPFRVGTSIACYVKPGGYSLNLQIDGKEVGKAHISALMGSTRLTIVSDATGSVVFGNGAEVTRTKQPLRLNGSARLGAGLLKRYWTGEIEYFDVYDHPKFQGPFDATAGRLGKAGRIAAL